MGQDTVADPGFPVGVVHERIGSHGGHMLAVPPGSTTGMGWDHAGVCLHATTCLHEGYVQRSGFY